MKRSLMVAAALAAFALPAMAPATVLAQDGESHGRRARGDTLPNDDEERHVRPDTPERPSRPDRPDRPPTVDRPRLDRPGRFERPDESQDPDGPGRSVGPYAPDRPRLERPDRPDRPGRPERPNHPDRPLTPDRPRPDHPVRPDHPDRPRDHDDDRDEWRDHRRDHREDRRDHRHDYREFHDRFDQDLWRRNWNRSHRDDWWRHDRRFRGYSGFRFGFYFAPGYGYYNVPRSYWGQRYHVGDYLPSIFWRYQLNDWRTYGLGYPPAGTRWVLVDNHIYLIDQYDGYIIDVIFDAWRW